ncbi:MAG: SDR family NAD(P)-dependent oxidoreductase, partial [Terriglobia bacterium]
NVASAAGYLATEPLSAYCTTKYAVLGLSESLADELRRHGIGVTCICPGIIETDMVKTILRQSPDPEAERRRRIEQLAVGRIGQPEDVARLALYLASDESSWMTAAAIPLDAGFTAA